MVVAHALAPSAPPPMTSMVLFDEFQSLGRALERQWRMQLVYGVMAWKSAIAFVMSSELKVPDCVIAGAVSREGVLLAARPIVRKPLGVGPIESAVGDEVVALLPRGTVTLDRETEAALVRVFGVGGEFEVRTGGALENAAHVEKGRPITLS